jgi:hypothetical protein
MGDRFVVASLMSTQHEEMACNAVVLPMVEHVWTMRLKVFQLKMLEIFGMIRLFVLGNGVGVSCATSAYVTGFSRIFPVIQATQVVTSLHMFGSDVIGHIVLAKGALPIIIRRFVVSFSLAGLVVVVTI